MSLEKNRKEAMRWMDTAKGDLDTASILIPTRYPNGLPDITPEQAFLPEDAKSCIEHASQVVQTVLSIIV